MNLVHERNLLVNDHNLSLIQDIEAARKIYGGVALASSISVPLLTSVPAISSIAGAKGRIFCLN